MNRNVTLIVFIVLIVVGITAFIYYKKNHFQKYEWVPDYRKNNEQPYGLKLFYTAVKSQKAKTTILFNKAYDLLDTSLSNSNLIFVGDDFYVDSLSAQYILKYVEKGNRVLISSNRSPLEILSNFVPIGDSIEGFSELRDSIVNINFITDSIPYPNKLSFHYQYIKDTVARNWNHYKKQYFNDTLSYFNFIPFSFINDSNINCFFIRHGKGKIIVHANPILFTNYYLVRKNGFEHTNNLLSQLNSGPIYWDDPYTVEPNNSKTAKNNPLKFLFSHPYLKWAWYLFLITIVLYLIFRSKREQRIIPLVPINTNTTIEFTKAIGTLYFQNKGHKHIANEMYTIFLSDIRSRYNIYTDIAEIDLIDQLTVRSGINKNVIYNLFKQFKYVRNDDGSNTDDLIRLYDSIENYNKKRK